MLEQLEVRRSFKSTMVRLQRLLFSLVPLRFCPLSFFLFPVSFSFRILKTSFLAFMRSSSLVNKSSITLPTAPIISLLINSNILFIIVPHYVSRFVKITIKMYEVFAYAYAWHSVLNGCVYKPEPVFWIIYSNVYS